MSAMSYRYPQSSGDYGKHGLSFPTTNPNSKLKKFPHGPISNSHTHSVVFLNIPGVSDTADEIQVMEPSMHEAKRMIAKYFKENDGMEISYSELFDALNIDLTIIIDACSELEAEGKIG